MDITMLIAIADNNVIGDGGKLPWHLSSDLKRFKRMTMGKCVIVGRKTYESMPELKGREVIVVTKRGVPCDMWAETPEKALAMAVTVSSLIGAGEIIVAGGKMIYEAMEEYLTKAVVTHLFDTPFGDTIYKLGIRAIDNANWGWNVLERGRDKSKINNREIGYEVLVGRRLC